jgi:hypothetical protein
LSLFCFIYRCGKKPRKRFVHAISLNYLNIILGTYFDALTYFRFKYLYNHFDFY